MMEGKAGKCGWGNRKQGIASVNYANVCRTCRMTPNSKQGRERAKKKRRWKSTGRGMGESASRSHVPPSKSCHFRHSLPQSVAFRSTSSRRGQPSVGGRLFPVSATSSCRHGNCVPHLVVLVVVVVTADKLVQRGEEGGREERP